MMREQDFYESVRERIIASLPAGFEDAEVSLTRQVKQNDTVKCGITIKKPGESICPIIYLDDFYRQYEDGKPIDSLIGQIVDLRAGLSPGIAQEINPASLGDYEAVRPRLQMRIFDTEKNEKRLEDIVHHSYGDFSAGYAVKMGESEHKTMFVMITPSMMEMWGITKRRLHDDTILADLSREPVLVDMGSMMMSFGDGTDCRNFLKENKPIDPQEVDMPMFVLTSQDRIHGAGLILNPVVQQKIAHILGGDYYVLPSSIHEVLVLPNTGGRSVRDLTEMVREVNRTMVAPDEVLSDKVQFYDSRSKTLMNAEEHERSQEKVPVPGRGKSI